MCAAPVLSVGRGGLARAGRQRDYSSLGYVKCAAIYSVERTRLLFLLRGIGMMDALHERMIERQVFAQDSCVIGK